MLKWVLFGVSVGIVIAAFLLDKKKPPKNIPERKAAKKKVK
jgi:hypothetical protein